MDKCKECVYLVEANIIYCLSPFSCDFESIEKALQLQDDFLESFDDVIKMDVDLQESLDKSYKLMKRRY